MLLLWILSPVNAVEGILYVRTPVVSTLNQPYVLEDNGDNSKE
jgi:hypothetical protein